MEHRNVKIKTSVINRRLAVDVRSLEVLLVDVEPSMDLVGGNAPALKPGTRGNFQLQNPKP